MSDALPDEVQDHVRWALKAKADDMDLVFYKKCGWSRGGAWDKTIERFGTGGERNAWRKLHTENYWVWFRPKETREQASTAVQSDAADREPSANHPRE